jgi:hypothetical protein
LIFLPVLLAAAAAVPLDVLVTAFFEPLVDGFGVGGMLNDNFSEKKSFGLSCLLEDLQYKSGRSDLLLPIPGP